LLAKKKPGATCVAPGFFLPEFYVVSQGPIAGKPAPTGVGVYTKLQTTISHCGSWLASDEAIPDDNKLSVTPQVAESTSYWRR
jgi:hypothetical protein